MIKNHKTEIHDQAEIQELRQRLEEAEETLRAIRNGEVDAIVVSGPKGEKIFTLKDSERSYRVMVESMSEGAATMTLDGYVLYANGRLAEMLGISLEKLLGTCLENFIQPGDLAAYRSLLLGRQHAGRIELTLRGRAGAGVPVHLSMRHAQIENTDSICLVATDLSEQKQNQERLAQTERELNSARRLSDIGALAATVAHELRNPLASIGIAAKLLQLKTGPVAQEQVTMIEKKINESEQIINNLLFYSRIRPPMLQPVSMPEILRECVALAGRRYTQIPIEVHEDALQALDLSADPLQMKELFSNLINNACEAVPKENGRVSIFAEQPQPDQVRICVQDNGVGMSEEVVKKVFEPFFSTKSQGTGLGLTVANQVVNLHSGELKISSRPGKGTRVCVSLPLNSPSRAKKG